MGGREKPKCGKAREQERRSGKETNGYDKRQWE